MVICPVCVVAGGMAYVGQCLGLPIVVIGTLVGIFLFGMAKSTSDWVTNKRGKKIIFQLWIITILFLIKTLIAYRILGLM